MSKVTIPADLANALHEYLMTRPMREVEALVAALRQAEPVDADKKDA